MQFIKKFGLLLGISTVGIALDQFTKGIAKAQLENHPPIVLLNGFFTFVYTENTGAFLSFGAKLPEHIGFWLLGIVPILLLVGLVIYFVKKSDQLSYPVVIGLALILAGGGGNLIDRITNNRHVVDFMYIYLIGPIHTGVFNVADLYIVAGAIILVFLTGRKPAQKNSKTLPS